MRAPRMTEVNESLSQMLELPEGRPVVRFPALARALEPNGLSRALGAEGAAPALVANEIAERGRTVLYVAPDLEAARKAADDVSFLSPEGVTLLFTPSETSPYAEV